MLAHHYNASIGYTHSAPHIPRNDEVHLNNPIFRGFCRRTSLARSTNVSSSGIQRGALASDRKLPAWCCVLLQADRIGSRYVFHHVRVLLDLWQPLLPSWFTRSSSSLPATPLPSIQHTDYVKASINKRCSINTATSNLSTMHSPAMGANALFRFRIATPDLGLGNQLFGVSVVRRTHSSVGAVEGVRLGSAFKVH